MVRIGAVVLLLSAAAPAAAQEDFDDEEQAQQQKAKHGESRQTLAERIPAVTRRFFSKAGRIELAPALGLSLNDPFFRHLTLGGGLTFHISESLAIGASGEYFAAFETGVRVTGGGTAQRPTYDRPTYAARLDITWAPLYGKLSLLAETVLHFDTYIIVGGGVIGPNQSEPSFAGSIALGQHYVLSEWFALKLELRDQIFPMKRNPQVAGENIENLLTATLGLCFYLPTEVERPSL